MGHTILLADDSITIQKVIELTFSDEDFALHTVGNGQKAIEEIRAVKPDIVLCDIIMPEKNGYEVCEFIKTADDLKHIPVLLLTGAFEPFDQDRAKKAGCDGFLAKPFEPQTLISKVKELLASAGAQPAAAAPALPEMPAAAPAPPVVEPTPAPSVEPPTVEMSFPPESPEPPSPPLTEPPAPAPAPPEPMSAPPVPPEPPAPAPSIPEPSPPMPAIEDEGATIMADNFAVEAGEKELSVEPGDQTVLLGDDDTPTVPSEDIWKEVQKGPEAVAPPEPTPQPEAPRDEGATVYLSPTEEVAPPGAGEPSIAPSEPEVEGGFNDFAAPAPDSGARAPNDDAWVLPSTDEPPEPQPAEPELTPLGDFGGFDDFSSGEPKPEEPEPVAPEPPPLSPEPEPPGADMGGEPSPFEVPETPVAPETPIGFGIPSEPEPPLAPVESGSPLSDLPMSPEGGGGEAAPSFEEPAPPIEPTPIEEPTPFVEPSPVMEAPPEMEPPAEASPMMDLPPEPTPVADLPPEPVLQEPVAQEPVAEPGAPMGEPMIEPPSSEPVMPAAPQEPALTPDDTVQPPVAPPAMPLETEAMPQDVDALVDQIAERVVAKLSDKVIKELAWEVVPDLAETLIQKEIDALKAKIPK